MKERWLDRAQEDLQYWQGHDQKIVERIQRLITDIKATPFTGLGKPEPLKYGRSGWWSRRITQEHRLVYRVRGDILEIAQCRYHT